MTAIVAILNKRAIAVAGDSAETIGGGMKIYNRANKIFTLSKYHPIGVAIYNEANFNSLIPWETIIKMYRDSLSKNSFNYLEDYKKDFITFLQKYLEEHLKEDECNHIICQHLYAVFRTDILSKLPKTDVQTGISSNESLLKLKEVLSSIKSNALKHNKFKPLDSLTFENFVIATGELFKEIKKQIEQVKGKYSDYENLLKETFFEIYRREILKNRSFTGIAFFGFGESEIFPCLYEIEIYSSIRQKLIWIDKNCSIMSTEKNAIICPMAQTDVILEYITGIHPILEQVFVNLTGDTIKNVLADIKNIIKPADVNLADKIGQIDLSSFLQQYVEDIRTFKQNNIITPLIQTVATMEKEDLGELAENLIYLTSLKRRITPELESVGGPVDVAIVSKGDGFVWIKRKHYFDPDLNGLFFRRYFLEQLNTNE